MKLTSCLLVIVYLNRCKGRSTTGISIVDVSSSASSVNITVPFEICFSNPSVEVDALVTSSSSGFTFNIFVFKINLLSFEAELVRTDQTLPWALTSVSVKWKSFHKSVLRNVTPGSYDIHYFYRPSGGLTWTAARSFCQKVRNRDLCNLNQVCNITSGTVASIGMPFGDNWTPVKDSTGNWTQIGDQGRLCWDHVPAWGSIAGKCPPQSTKFDPCYPRGHLFCCNPAI